MMIVTAKEAQRLNTLNPQNGMLNDIFGAISAISEFETRLSYYTEGKRLTDEDLNALTSMGYSVEFNPITGCYNVSWAN